MASRKQIDELKIILEEKQAQIESNIADSKNNIAQLKENECKDDFDFATATQQDISQIGCLLATNTCVVARGQQHLTVADEARVCQMFGNFS